MKNIYQKRNKILEDMGWKDYAQYLRSDLWKEIRNKIFSIYSNKCYCCNRVATIIHHRFYSLTNLKGESDQGLVPLCKKCHYKVEFKKNKKVFWGVDKRLQNRRKSLLSKKQQNKQKTLANKKRKMERDRKIHKRMCDG